LKRTGKTKTVTTGNPKFKNKITFEEVRGRKKTHWVKKGKKKKPDPLRRYYHGWKCRECGEQNSNYDKECRSCGCGKRET